ncbi:ribosome biogenesis GTPase YqeH [Alteribacillus sp. HJP-4]|uniref:ribosome biogenesis GTPase YqeH n=1 Tax=Alteribacillus sp. HJP-4 TaxID=2775394 RepID=UPI0035CCD3C9
MDEKLICAGCGAQIQTTDSGSAGYTPPSALDKAVVICRRCFRLKHYNEVQAVDLNDSDFIAKLHELSSRHALIVKIVDIFDFEGSWIPGFQRFAAHNEILLLANKSDLLPKSVNENKVISWIKKSAKDQGLRVSEVMLISASKGKNVQDAAALMDKMRSGRDVYVTGCTNVGKSTFINRIIKEFGGDEEQLITTSHFPGTTLDMIDLPLDDGKSLYDTPGIINHKQMAHFVNTTELKQITPKKEIKPVNFQLEAKQTLFIGALARFDFESGDKNSFVAYFSNDVNIHRTKLENADSLFESHAGDMLFPPGEDTLKEMPEWKKYTFHIRRPKTDIIISGLGWITVVSQGAEICVHAPEGVGVSLREGII